MKLVLDTNVLMSAIFFGGTPYRVLNAWREGRMSLVVSADILAEYQRTGAALSAQFPLVDLTSWIELITAQAELVRPAPLPSPVCTDPDDDKFLACALAASAKYICSGDKALLKTSGYRGIKVLTPGQLLAM